MQPGGQVQSQGELAKSSELKVRAESKSQPTQTDDDDRSELEIGLLIEDIQFVVADTGPQKKKQDSRSGEKAQSGDSAFS